MSEQICPVRSESLDDAVTIRSGAAAALALIDQYEIIRKLGGGGYGSVYLARDTVAGIEVAVKGLPPDIRNNTEEVERIRANFALVSRLHHPYIAAALHLHRVQLADYRVAGVYEELNVGPGDTLMVMEYAPGLTLSSWQKQFPNGRVPLETAINICYQVASALDYAHERQILHRDVKPSNIMVETLADGSVISRIIDFGIAAEIRQSMGRVSMEIRDTSGTRPYMAPEQWEGRRQGPATDQYALACIFCELVTGAVPFGSVFDTGDPMVMMSAVCGREAELPPDCPRQHALRKALAKDPLDRYASCSAFIENLAKSEARFDAEHRAHAPRSHRGRLLVLLLVVLALAGGGVAFYRHRRVVQPVGEIAVEALPEVPPAMPQVLPAVTPKVASRPKRPNGLKDIDRQHLPELWSAPGVKEHVLLQGLGTENLTFVECPPGTFTMGYRKQKGDPFYRHRVTLTYPFWILKTQLTKGQSYIPGFQDDGKGDRHGRNSWDVYRISAYLAMLNRQFASKIPKGYVIRFPTFAEYQYAYRANSTDPEDPYTHDEFRGDDSRRICFNNDERKGWNGNRRTWPRVWNAEVGLLEPNAWGIYDMAGNGFTYLCDRVNPDLPGSSHYSYREHEIDPIIYEEDASNVLMRGGDSPNWIYSDFFMSWRWAFTYRLVVGPDLERKGREQARAQNLARHERAFRDMLTQLKNRTTGPAQAVGVKTLEILPGYSLRFIKCPAGIFTMGHDFAEGPFHRREVKISQPFMMAEERLTMGLYFAYLETIGKPVPADKRLYAERRGGLRSALCGISGDEWKNFLAWLNGRFQKKLHGYVFRLPTEAEWEYAYRAGSNRQEDPFAWTVPFVGNHIDAAKPYAYTEDERRADFQRYGKGRIVDTLWSAYTTDWRRRALVDPGLVGTKKPNAWGFKDMIGNGSEWVIDRFKASAGQFPAAAYSKESRLVDPLFGYELDDWNCQMSRGGDDGYAGPKCWDANGSGWDENTSYQSSRFSYRLVIGPDLIARKRAKGK